MNEQEIQQQIVLLVLAAMSGDLQANQQIQQIMQAAQQGDRLAAQLAQMILAVAQQMQQLQVQSAKFGAKLNYIRHLRGLCPEGTEMMYFKSGGTICKKCVAKQYAGGEMEMEMAKDPIKLFKKRKEVNQDDTLHTITLGIVSLTPAEKRYKLFNSKKATRKERERASEKDYNAGRQYIQGPVNRK